MLSANGATGSKIGPKYIPDSGMPSHLIKSLSSALAALKTCNKIRVTSVLINQTTELHDQPTSPHTHTSCAPPFPSQHTTEMLYSVGFQSGFALANRSEVPTALLALSKSTAETTSILKPGAFWPAL
eukprot:5753117-Pleurochrysis_carterae.AAC.1